MADDIMLQLFANTVLESERLRLRAMREEDSELIVKWRSDPEIRKWLLSTTPLTVESHLKWFHKLKADRLDFIICVKDPEIPIGTINYININFQNAKAETGKMLGDRSQWGKGLAKEASLLWYKFGFEQLSLRYIYILIRVENKKIIKLDERIGFKAKKVLKGIYKNGNNLVDVLIVEDASHPRQCAADFIRCLLGAKRLTTSECSRQSHRQTSLPPVLLLIRSALWG